MKKTKQIIYKNVIFKKTVLGNDYQKKIDISGYIQKNKLLNEI